MWPIGTGQAFWLDASKRVASAECKIYSLFSIDNFLIYFHLWKTPRHLPIYSSKISFIFEANFMAIIIISILVGRASRCFVTTLWKPDGRSWQKITFPCKQHRRSAKRKMKILQINSLFSKEKLISSMGKFFPTIDLSVPLVARC